MLRMQFTILQFTIKVYNFINSMIEEHTYCSEVMKNHFNKEIVMTKEDNKDFNGSTKFWICVND